MSKFKVGDIVWKSVYGFEEKKWGGVKGIVVLIDEKSLWSLRPVYHLIMEDGGRCSVEEKEITLYLRMNEKALNLGRCKDQKEVEEELSSLLNMKKPGLGFVMDDAENFFMRFSGYIGTAISDWHPVEDQLFMFVANWFGAWLRENSSTALTAMTQQELQDLQAAIPRYNTKLGKQWQSPTQANQVIKLEIFSLKSYLGAIASIGSNEKAQTALYCLKLGANTYVFLDSEGHYARPYIVNGNQANVNQYQEEYSKLMEHGSANISPTDVKNFIKTGQTPNSLDSVTVLAANYICECDRNWVHLLAVLLELGAGRTSFQSKELNRYVMNGGSWKNQYSWGKGKNPNANSSAKDSDGYEIQRWLLRLVIEATRISDDSDK